MAHPQNHGVVLDVFLPRLLQSPEESVYYSNSCLFETTKCLWPLHMWYTLQITNLNRQNSQCMSKLAYEHLIIVIEWLWTVQEHNQCKISLSVQTGSLRQVTSMRDSGWCWAADHFLLSQSGRCDVTPGILDFALWDILQISYKVEQTLSEWISPNLRTRRKMVMHQK